MAEWCTVTGRFVSHQEHDSAPLPLAGRVVFQARTNAREDNALYGAAPVTGWIVGGVLCEDQAGTTPGVRLLAPSEGVDPGAWSVRVSPALRDGSGNPVSWRGFDVLLTPGGTVDLVQAAPVPDPDTGQWVTRGEQGEPGRDALMLAPDPVIRGLFVMVRGAVPVDATGMIPIGPMLRSER